MKILWITNILFPEVVEILTGNGDFKSSGGWLIASADVLARQNDIKLYVATVSTLVRKTKVLQGKQITYYVLPYGKGNDKYNKEYESYWRDINEEVKPDVVHIHGTEYSHGFAYTEACGNLKVVVSIQGMKSGIAPHYCAGLSCKDVYSSLTFRDIIKGSIYKEQCSFYESGRLEKEFLHSVKHVIGRTSWDKAHVWAINPNANYYVCNETLRSEFYEGLLWNYDNCVPSSIFLSQGSYPLKGLHQLLKAMPLILRHFPDTKIRIAGNDITKNKGVRGLLYLTGYGRFVRNLIKKYNLSDKVEFLGPLNAAQMKNEYLRCNVFICPSSVENSPNSLGEAQILGVPCVASYVGGVPDFMQGNERYMYRFEETEMLAYKIVDVFRSKGNIDTSVMRKHALIRHNVENNILQLLDIYRVIAVR